MNKLETITFLEEQIETLREIKHQTINLPYYRMKSGDLIDFNSLTKTSDCILIAGEVMMAQETWDKGCEALDMDPIPCIIQNHSSAAWIQGLTLRRKQLDANYLIHLYQQLIGQYQRELADEERTAQCDSAFNTLFPSV